MVNSDGYKNPKKLHYYSRGEDRQTLSDSFLHFTYIDCSQLLSAHFFGLQNSELEIACKWLSE